MGFPIGWSASSRRTSRHLSLGISKGLKAGVIGLGDADADGLTQEQRAIGHGAPLERPNLGV
jgi:hypothetical protein